MACSAACCCASSHGLFYRSLTTTSRRPARLRLIYPSSAPAPRLSSRTLASPDPPPLDADDRDDAIGFEIQVSKMGKRNRRVVRARVRVDAPLEAVWATLTDYEGLADFIPGLSECRLLDQAHGFARLYQVGEQDLALGFKFNAKGTIDCYEGDMESLPDAAGARRREIAFNMIDGDFKVFKGKWSVQEEEQGGGPGDSYQYHTTLSYLVELEPKLWVPVRLLEGRICSEIKNNLVSIREQAQQQHEAALHAVTGLLPDPWQSNLQICIPGAFAHHSVIRRLCCCCNQDC
ncbi:uncharacterized protein LOC112894102 isoform X3 [Panicum hallii]|uniref:uncharacterized protein LOC112894102 isoform X3 n=1 Tax=Panicum hallii TaxID=206008 RepID=UPI000DF4CB9D|nr:uncharacterized protein LOC112894102 isoform X3 [Panicum hallii]